MRSLGTIVTFLFCLSFLEGGLHAIWHKHGAGYGAGTGSAETCLHPSSQNSQKLPPMHEDGHGHKTSKEPRQQTANRFQQGQQDQQGRQDEQSKQDKQASLPSLAKLGHEGVTECFLCTIWNKTTWGFDAELRGASVNRRLDARVTSNITHAQTKLAPYLSRAPPSLNSVG